VETANTQTGGDKYEIYKHASFEITREDYIRQLGESFFTQINFLLVEERCVG